MSTENKEYTVEESLLGVRKELLSMKDKMKELNSLVGIKKLHGFSVYSAGPFGLSGYCTDKKKISAGYSSVAIPYYAIGKIIPILNDWNKYVGTANLEYMLENKKNSLVIRDEKRLLELIEELKELPFYKNKTTNYGVDSNGKLLFINSNRVSARDINTATAIEYNAATDQINIHKNIRTGKSKIEGILDSKLDDSLFTPYIKGLIDEFESSGIEIVRDFEIRETSPKETLDIKEENDGKRLILVNSMKN